MKILHISMDNTGGAGLAAERLHLGLRAAGIDSKMLVLRKRGDAEEVHRYREHGKNLPSAKSGLSLIRAASQRMGLPISRAQRYRNRVHRLKLKTNPAPFFTLPFTSFDVTTHPLVRESDIIHLHWVADFVDIPTFFRNVDKPVVWTLHDENAFLGGFHYAAQRDQANATYRALDDELANAKCASIMKANSLTFKFLSRMMEEKYRNHRIVAGRPTFTIPNSVDTRVFRPVRRSLAREFWGLSDQDVVLCFAANPLWGARKGLRELIEAVRMLDRSDLTIMAIGKGNPNSPSGVPVFFTGHLTDERLMALAYSAGDVFVMPSFQEAFAQTPLEAMACGLPTVAFPCSGTEELMYTGNGVLTSEFTSMALAAGLRLALTKTYDAAGIRADISERFRVDVIVRKHLVAYQKVISHL